MDERKKRGDRGEDAVAAALARKGFRLLERQYRCRLGEIDLIAADETYLCFVGGRGVGPLIATLSS